MSISLIDDPLYQMIHGSENVYSDIDPEAQEKILYGWNSDNQIFLRLIEDTKPKYILEIGSWLGSSAIHMARFIKSRGLETKIVCVDTWLGSREFVGKQFPGDRSKLIRLGVPIAYLHFLSNIKQEDLCDYIIPFPQTSSNALRFLSQNDVRFQMIYIDGSNQYEDIKSDMNLSWNVLADGGVIFGDDYLNFAYPQINAAVNSFVHNNRIRDNLTIDDNKVFWSIKKKGLI